MRGELDTLVPDSVLDVDLEWVRWSFLVRESDIAEDMGVRELREGTEEESRQ